MKTKSGKVSFNITITKEAYECLEELCLEEGRSLKSRQITWIINQYWAIKKTRPEQVLSLSELMSLPKSSQPAQDVVVPNVIPNIIPFPVPVSNMRKCSEKKSDQ